MNIVNLWIFKEFMEDFAEIPGIFQSWL